jgi:hypothetical protein
MLFSMTQIATAANIPNDGKIIANPDPGATIDWANVATIQLGMTLSGGNVNWSGSIRGLSGTTRIEAAFILERWNGSSWVFVTSWFFVEDSAILMASGSTPGSSGTYRLTVSAFVTRNGFTEHVVHSVERIL